MPALTAWIGGLLTATGVIAYIVTSASSVTALIPAFVGVLLLITAWVATRSDLARRHAMHAALLIALLGALGSVRNLGGLTDLFAGDAERPAAVITSLIMFVVLVFFLVMGVRSFVAARRSGSDSAATAD